MKEVFSIVLFNKVNRNFFICLNNKYKGVLKNEFFNEIKKIVNDLRNIYLDDFSGDDNYYIYFVTADNLDSSTGTVDMEFVTKPDLYLSKEKIIEKINNKELVKFLSEDIVNIILKSSDEDEIQTLAKKLNNDTKGFDKKLSVFKF